MLYPLVSAGGTGGATTLPAAYNNGVAGPQLITEDVVRLGLYLDAAGHLGTDGGNHIFAAFDSTKLDPTGLPNGIRVTNDGELEGSQEVAFRQRIMLYGGNAAGPSDCAIRITRARSIILPAGILILGAQDAVQPSIQSGGPVYIVPGLGGQNAGGINGPIINGQPGIENSGGADDAHAPYTYLDGPPNAGNPTNGFGYSLRSRPGSSSVPAMSFSSVTRFNVGTAPMARFYEGVLGGAGRNLVEIWGNSTSTMIVYGAYGTGGPLIVRTDASDTGQVGTGVTIDAISSGGRMWAILARGNGGVAGNFSVYDFSTGGLAGERISITAAGVLQLGVSTVLQNLNAAQETATIGAAGGAAALPALPLGYLTVKISSGANVKIPYYNP